MDKKILALLTISIIAISAIALITIKQNQETNKQELQQKFQLLKTQYEEAKANGYDVSEVERLGIQAKQAFDKGDYRKANELIDEVLKTIKELAQNKIYPVPIEIKVETICTDGIDNDGDGLTDNDDGDCWIREGAVFMEDFTPVRSFEEIEKMLPELKGMGIKTVELLPVWKACSFGDPWVRWQVSDYSIVDPDRGGEEKLQHFIGQAHDIGLKVVPMLSITEAFPPYQYKDACKNRTILGVKLYYDQDGNGGYFYQYQLENPDKKILLQNLDGKYTCLPPGFGFSVNQNSEDTIELIESIYRKQILNRGFDGVRMDANGVNNCADNEMIYFLCNKYVCPDPVKKRHTPLPLYRRLTNLKSPDQVFLTEVFSSEHIFSDYSCNYPYYSSYPDIDEVAEVSEGYEFISVLEHVVTNELNSSELVDWVNEQPILYDRQRFRMIRNWNKLGLNFLGFVATNPGYYSTVTLTSTIPGIPKVSDYELFGNKEWDDALGIVPTNLPEERKEHWKKILNVRNDNNALKYGDIENVWKSGDNTYAYSRTYENETVIVVINFDDKQVTSVLDVPFKKEDTLKDELSGETFAVSDPNNFRISVPAHSSRILVLQTDQCIPTEPGKELSCSDGIDNDCDGKIDSDDSDCKKSETQVIAGIPQMEDLKNNVNKPSWNEISDSLLEFKAIGVNTIFIWTPYKALWLEEGTKIPVTTKNGIKMLDIKNTFIVEDYMVPDPDRGSEQAFLNMIKTAHSLDMKVVGQLQITVTAPKTFIYENHPEWMIESIYGEPAIFWPRDFAPYGYIVDKTNPELINYVTETVIPHWIKEWGLDSIYLDSPGMGFCDTYIKNLCDRTGYAEGFECLTPVASVEGHYSPEPLVKAMKFKLEELSKEIGKNLTLKAELSFMTSRDMPDELIKKTCNGNINGWLTDSRVDRSLGKYFDWVLDYNFRGLLKTVYNGTDYSYSSDYVDSIKFMKSNLDGEYTKTVKFVNMWIETFDFKHLLSPHVSNAFITLSFTAPGNIVWIGTYQIIIQEEVGEMLGYKPKILKEQYKKLLMIKKSHPALQSDNIEDALIYPNRVKKLIAYNRWIENESVTVIVNVNDNPVEAVVRTRFSGNEIIVHDLLNNEALSGDPVNFRVSVPAYGSRILTIKR